METARTAVSTTKAAEVDTEVVGRFHPDSVRLHNFRKLAEYILPSEAAEARSIARSDPTGKDLTRKEMRRRDSNRKVRKVRNPLFTSYSPCLVCKYQFGIKKETLGYCVECTVSKFTNWPSTNRAKGFAKAYHPRLCSVKCFELFHTQNIRDLDYLRKRQRSKSKVKC